PEVYAIGSTSGALKIAAEAGIPFMTNGSVAGIPAILLNEGSWRNYNVIVLLVKVLRDAPDFRAGAAIAEALARLAPGATCDVSALLKQAEVMEATLKKLRSEQVQHTTYENIYG
nr:PAC2 family protein [Thermoproteota archaeon]